MQSFKIVYKSAQYCLFCVLFRSTIMDKKYNDNNVINILYFTTIVLIIHLYFFNSIFFLIPKFTNLNSMVVVVVASKQILDREDNIADIGRVRHMECVGLTSSILYLYNIFLPSNTSSINMLFYKKKILFSFKWRQFFLSHNKGVIVYISFHMCDITLIYKQYISVSNFIKLLKLFPLSLSLQVILLFSLTGTK
ncbi:hypothetical protein GQR58_006946 [Nymphon striatum]|nr:hypothetical protein GQR58_006946 [Nymphon striatum]